MARLSSPGRALVTATLAVLLSHALANRAAHADEGEFDSEKYWREAEAEQREHGYWHVSLLGGVAVPTATMSSSYKEGLTASLRVGYTARFGLGVTLGGSYSPLPLRNSTGESGESQLFALTACPRFTLGRELLRAWFGAGGGIAFESASGISGRSTTAEFVAQGEAGLEVHVFSSGGLALGAGYTRSFGETIGARLFSALGGLVFTFK
jgi:hypothetical protein